MNALKRYLNAKRYRAKLNLLERIHTEVEPIIRANREAWEKLGNGVTPYLENSPETYGVKRSLPEIYTLVSMGQSADCELDETSARFVAIASHDHTDESLAAPIPHK